MTVQSQKKLYGSTIFGYEGTSSQTAFEGSADTIWQTEGFHTPFLTNANVVYQNGTPLGITHIEGLDGTMYLLNSSRRKLLIYSAAGYSSSDGHYDATRGSSNDMPANPVTNTPDLIQEIDLTDLSLVNTTWISLFLIDGTIYLVRSDLKFYQLTYQQKTGFYQVAKDYTGQTSDVFQLQLNEGAFIETSPSSYKWAFEAFNDENGYPNSISIYENRLVLGGNKKNPNVVFLSKTNEFDDFQLGSLDTDALKLEINSSEAEDIQWFCPQRELVIGTSNNEWTLSSGNSETSLTPTQLSFKRRSKYGSNDVQAVLSNSAILFLQRQGTKLREWFLQGNENDYLGNELSLIANHITQYGFIQMALQTEPYNIVWLVSNNGDLIGLTYERETEVFAWHRHTFNETVNYLSLDGANDYVDAPHVNFQNNATIDFTLNFKLRQSSTEREWLVNQAGSFEIDIRANATNEFYLILGRDTNGTSITYNKILQFNNDFTDNQWHTLHITVDPTSTTNNITATIDGVSTTSTSNLSFDFSGTTFQHANQANYNFLIGNARSYQSPYNGDESLFPDGNPTDTLDLDLNSLVLKVGSSTKFNYLFNTGSGTTVTDTAGSNNASIINNTSPNWVSEVIINKVESVAVLPNKTSEDSVYLSIKNSNNTNRNIVKFNNYEWGTNYTTEYSGLDLYKKYTNHSSQTVSGLEHLEGKSVTAKVNGVVETKIVSSGAITLASTPSNATVYVGLPYTSTLAPLYVDAEGSMGSKKSIPHATIRFKDTLEAKVGQKETGTDNVKFASSSSLNTEDAEVWLANHNEFLQTVYIVSDTPQPCTVLAMVVDVEGV